MTIPVTDTDKHWSARSTYPRDRLPSSRDEVLAESLEAWRLNALGRRAVGLTTQYSIGAGISIESPHEGTNDFLQKWWSHPQNHMDTRVFELSDELSRSGELFVTLSTDYTGMTFIRAIPAADIQEIYTDPKDAERELIVYERPRYDQPETNNDGLRGRAWPVYDQSTDQVSDDGLFVYAMLHFAVNRPVGGVHGESDLAPVTRWILRYSTWLEDRVRLNRFRQSFMYIVRGRYASPEEKAARQAALSADPPPPGTILVTDENEAWGVLNPQLASFEAGEDGLAIKKMISAGTGNPLHFLAEPESSTRTTAEAAGGPTFRHYEQRQRFFVHFLRTVASAVVYRRAQVNHRVSVRAEINVKAGDISSRDNVSLAQASSTIASTLLQLRQAKRIDDNELMRMVYRFAGETVNTEDLLARGAGSSDWPMPFDASVVIPNEDKIKIDPETGDEVARIEK